MKKKGFPESYDTKALLRFLAAVKAGERHVRAPVYSHLVYDVVPGASVEVDRPDILIVEGLNVLQTGRPPREGKAIPFVSDYFDFSIFIDAEEEVLERWYLDRFMRLRETAFRDPQSYFRRYAEKSDFEAMKTALALWYGINLVNLRDNILPTRHRAKLILKKESDHRIESVSLRGWVRRGRLFIAKAPLAGTWLRNLPPVMPGLVPGIHDLTTAYVNIRGWPGQARP